MELLIDQFIRFETENNLFKDEIRNVKYWHIIRKEIFDAINQQKSSIGVAHTLIKNESIFNIIKLKIKQIPYLFIRNPLTFLKNKDILIFNHHRRVKDESVYKCVYTDSLIDNMDYSYYMFEEPFLEKHYTPIPKTNIKYIDIINNIYLFHRLINTIFKRKIISKYEQEKIRLLIEKINHEFMVDLDSNAWITKINNKILYYIVTYKYYSKIIDKVKPKVIIEVVSYLNSRFVINNIAKEKGIPVVELQHGTIGKYHIAYNFDNKINLSTFPDYIFLFGQFWKDNTSFPIEDSKVKIVGWPYYNQKVEQNEKNKNNNEKQVILFISQGTVGKELSKLALELTKKIDLNKYKIIYKLHPGEYARWEKEYPWLIDSNLDIIDHNDKDMHYYFIQSDIQIGVYSTAIFEGLGYGLKTFIFKLYGHEYIEELYDKKLAKLVESTDELIDCLNNNQDIELGYNKEYFWKENSLENIIREINTIVDN